MKAKCAYGITTGISRKNQGIECQDKIRTINENGLAAVILADGTGKRAQSGLCASIVVDAAAKLLRDKFDELYSLEEEGTKQLIIAAIMNGLGKTELALIDMASTLIFVAAKDTRYLAGHIGSGVLISRKESCSVLSKPQDGSFNNETNYITDLDAVEKLLIYKGTVQEPLGFMLLSDGASHGVYDRSAESLSPVCGTLFQWLDEYDEETVSEALTDNIRKYFTQKTDDDITIAVMVFEDEANELTDAENATAKISDEGNGKASETISDKERSNEEAATVSAPPPDSGQKITNLPDSSWKSRVQKNVIIALIVIAAAVAGCLAISNSLSSTVKEPNTAKETPLAGEDNQESEKSSANGKSPAQTDGAAGEAPSPGAIQPASGSAIQPESANKMGEYYPSITYAVKNPKFFPAGNYKAGADIPAGEYFFYTGEMLQPESITINGESCLSGELYCMYIQIKEGDQLNSSCAFTASENVNSIQPAKGILLSGKYKIGKDVKPGTYTAMAIAQENRGKYYSILNGKISNDTAFRNSESVTVPEKGYIVLYNSAISSDKSALQTGVTALRSDS